MRQMILVVGGGVIGCSTAYHLARLGWHDVVVLERKQVSSGTTWHAAGLVTTLRDTEAQTKLATYSLKLYQDLEAETGQATGFIRCGSVQLAMSDDKAEEMRRGCAMARTFGVENHEIRQFSMIFTPSWRAPLASAWATSAGLTRPSLGK